MVSAQQSSDIYFPGRTNSNTNSVHNVVAELNRNTVLNFLGQPLQVGLPEQTNPFQIVNQQTSTNAQPIQVRPQQPVFGVRPPSTPPSLIRATTEQSITVAPFTVRPFVSLSNDQPIQNSQAFRPNFNGSPTPPSVQQRPSERNPGFEYQTPSTSSEPYVNFAFELFRVS